MTRKRKSKRNLKTIHWFIRLHFQPPTPLKYCLKRQLYSPLVAKTFSRVKKWNTKGNLQHPKNIFPLPNDMSLESLLAPLLQASWRWFSRCIIPPSGPRPPLPSHNTGWLDGPSWLPSLPLPPGCTSLLISVGPSPGHSPLWTASRPPWPAVHTGVHPACRRTHRPRHSLWSPGQCCTSAGPPASLGTLPGEREETKNVTMATGHWQRAIQQEGKSGIPAGPPPLIHNL